MPMSIQDVSQTGQTMWTVVGFDDTRRRRSAEVPGRNDANRAFHVDGSCLAGTSIWRHAGQDHSSRGSRRGRALRRRLQQYSQGIAL